MQHLRRAFLEPSSRRGSGRAIGADHFAPMRPQVWRVRATPQAATSLHRLRRRATCDKRITAGHPSDHWTHMNKRCFSLLRPRSAILGGLTVAIAVSSSLADEGMWLLSRPPLETLKARYHFEPSSAWLEHIQKSCVHMGASGSLVSPDGLVVTNHHVGSDQLAKLSTPEHDLLSEGFYARTREKEIKCPDLEVQILWSIEDVTQRVNAAVDAKMSAADAYTARRKAMTRIEQESKDATGLKSEVVTLYHGPVTIFTAITNTRTSGWCSLRRNRLLSSAATPTTSSIRATISIAASSESMTMVEPLQPEHHLSWSREGAADGELIFVFGHPGRTQPAADRGPPKLSPRRQMPEGLQRSWRREVQLTSFCNRGRRERPHRPGRSLRGPELAKGRAGGVSGRCSTQFLAAQAACREQLRAGGTADTAPWDKIAAAERRVRHFLYPLCADQCRAISSDQNCSTRP